MEDPYLSNQFTVISVNYLWIIMFMKNLHTPKCCSIFYFIKELPLCPLFLWSFIIHKNRMWSFFYLNMCSIPNKSEEVLFSSIYLIISETNGRRSFLTSTTALPNSSLKFIQRSPSRRCQKWEIYWHLCRGAAGKVQSFVFDCKKLSIVFIPRFDLFIDSP